MSPSRAKGSKPASAAKPATEPKARKSAVKDERRGAIVTLVFKSLNEQERKARFVACLPPRPLTESDEEGVKTILAESINEYDKVDLLISFLQSRK